MKKYFVLAVLISCIESIAIFAQPGSLDSTFNGTGIRITDIGAGFVVTSAVAIQPDGKIVAEGRYYNGINVDLALVRYNSDGSLDSTFSEDGIVITDIGVDLTGSAVAIQFDGKILIAGTYGSEVVAEFALFRFNSNGTIDSTFSEDGIQFDAVGVSNSNVTSLAIQFDGKILVAGGSNDGMHSSMTVLRYTTAGILDTTFSGDGKQFAPTPAETSSTAFSVAVQPDGKIVVVGAEDSDLDIVRYNSDGSLDSTFSGDGVQVTDVGWADYAYSIAIQTDGKIVLSGTSYTGTGSNFILLRYNSDGTLDNSFSDDGIQMRIGGAGSSAVLQSDGKILVGGLISVGSIDNFAILRYMSDGEIDPTFGSAGTQIINTGTHSGCNSIALQPDGKIVMIGVSNFSTVVGVAVVRCNNDSVIATPCFANYTTVYDSIANNYLLSVDSTSGAAAVSYHWDFGDGTTSSLAVPTHTYAMNGNYNVCMSIARSTGDFCTHCQLLSGDTSLSSGFTINIPDTIATPPSCIAHFTTSFDSTSNNYTLTVDSSTTSLAMSYRWDFGVGTSSVLAVPTHTYATAGSYNVCMKIYTASGDSCSYCQILTGDAGFTINIPDTTVIPSCIAGYTTDYDSTLNTFILNVDSVTTALATSYNWDFGDGSTSTLATPSHVYTVDSLYHVCMKVYYADGDSCTYCHTIGIDSAGNIIRDGGFSLVVQNARTGISENTNNQLAVNIYPNPNIGVFQLAVGNGQLNSTATLSIYNVVGEKIYVKDGKQLNASTTIDLSDQPNGIYFMQLKTEQNTVTKKIIINK